MGLKFRLIVVLMIPLVLVVGVYGFVRVGTGREELLNETARNVRAGCNSRHGAQDQGRRRRIRYRRVPCGGPPRRATLHDVEHHYIEQILAETKGDKSAAARILGVSVRTLQRMFKSSQS